jgi:ATP-dependent Clp protease adaptor protein ClpS
VFSTTNKGPRMAQSDTITKPNVKTDLTEPPMFKVIYLNDNQTTMEFVIETLMDFFDYNTETAVKITEDIHHAGSAVVAVLPYEVAEQKGLEVTVFARSNNYPLQVKLEPENS